MNREIKFRGFSKELNFFVYGYLTQVEVESKTYSYIFWQGNSAPVETASLGQYTGLKDKNGKEVYEKDMVKYVMKNEHSRTIREGLVEVYNYAWRVDRLWLFTEIEILEVIR